jgi:ABC-type transporter Mla MlaB component
MAASRPSTITFAIRGPIERADLPELYERVCALLADSGAVVAVCDIAGVAADAVAVEALARLQLAARRHGCRIRLEHPSAELCDLIAFMGLADVLTTVEPGAGGAPVG